MFALGRHGGGRSGCTPPASTPPARPAAAAATTAAAPATTAAYPEPARTAYVHACVGSTPGRQAFCECTLTELPRRVQAELARLGVPAGPELVRALMRELDLVRR